MKNGIVIATSLFIAGVLLALLQVWFQVFNTDIFIKLELTIGAFLLLVIVLIYVVKEYKDYKSIHEGEDIDM